jgi:hypothetical protein
MAAAANVWAQTGGKGKKGTSLASGTKLYELVGKYMVAKEETWGDDDGITKVYYLDPLRFKAFKKELDAGGEYKQDDWWDEKNRDWERRKTFARWCARPKGEFTLDLENKNNTGSWYQYQKVAGASGAKLTELLRKYMAPSWDEDLGDDGIAYVYCIDPLRFDELKSEFEALGEYTQERNGTDKNRDWDRGRSFAIFTVYAKGNVELSLQMKDNSGTWYRYKNKKAK